MVRLRSRFGNVALAVVGALYAVAGGSVLVWALLDTWVFAGRTEYALYMLLGFVVVVGGWFVSVGLRSLGARLPFAHFGRHDSGNMAASH